MTKEFDLRWITQYGALFCVMNGKGQVVTWKLTKDLTFNNIVHVGHLNALHDHVHKQGKHVCEFFIDNYCAWRNLLQSVYRTTLHVHLDVFHAVKRVSDKIPKKTSFAA